MSKRPTASQVDFFITSPPFACGLGWLINALIELGYRGTSLNHISTNWKQVKSGDWEIGEEARDTMASYLPSLDSKAAFKFRDGIQFQWEHRISYPANPNAPVIVVVRDPRDAIYSLHRRWTKNGWIDQSFTEFLQRPSEWPDHFPGMFHATPVTTFLLFCLTWMKEAESRPVMFVRFEDLKQKPEKTLLGVLKFLNLDLPSPEILSQAVASSNCRPSSSGAIAGAIFKGEVFEWQSSYTEEWKQFFQAPAMQALLRKFGYVGGRTDVNLEAIVQNNREYLRSAVVSRSVALAGFERLSKIASRAGGKWRIFLDQALVSDFWARSWALGRSPRVEAMRAFYLLVIRDILSVEEREFIVGRTLQTLQSEAPEELNNLRTKMSSLNPV